MHCTDILETPNSLKNLYSVSQTLHPLILSLPAQVAITSTSLLHQHHYFCFFKRYVHCKVKSLNRSHNVIADCVDELSELRRCWSGPSDEVMSIDQSYLKIMLENHILKDEVLLGQLYNGQLLETIAGKFLRVFVYRTVGPLSPAILFILLEVG